MNARERGRRTVRSITSVLARSGITVGGALGVASYVDIRSAKTAAAQAPTSTSTSTSGNDDSNASTVSGTGSQGTSPASGVTAGSAAGQTSSSGS
jgi:hypothetical protein